ncbi:MAG: hypothetical protein VKK42_17495 [Lyngbya sp.]|nr:hypothetical protein [Lyngbya sp.]
MGSAITALRFSRRSPGENGKVRNPYRRVYGNPWELLCFRQLQPLTRHTCNYSNLNR